MVDVAVVGAAGYAGIEAVRWVLGHPALTLRCATSTGDAGRPVGDVYPALRSMTDLVFMEPDPTAIAECAQVALLAVPHTAALALAPTLLDAGMTVIDMSADFRIKDALVYEQWYATAHTQPGLLASAVYGLPELGRAALPGARLVACAGCYPTATSLAAAPALESGLAVGTRVLVDAKSGVSGAGRSATAGTHYCQADEAVSAYKVAAHRHTPEMAQVLSDAAGRQIDVVFAPHLVPMSRGLLSTVYLDIAPGTTASQFHEVYSSRYAGEPFVTVHPLGVMPSTREVVGSNRAAMGIAVDERSSTLIITCVIDNLGKGAAGQAIQCLNAVLGHPETTGLDAPGPVV